MKNLISLTLLILIQIAFIPIFHCRIFPLDANIVDETCKKTPNYSLCESLLRSDNRSLNAKDTKGLAFIMIDVVQAKAREGTRKVDELLLDPKGPKDSLNSCMENYRNVNVDIGQAWENLTNGDNLATEDRLRDTAAEVDLCDEAFGGSSNPLAGFNKAVHDAGNMGGAIVATLG